jgi:hypothetical protein
MGMNRFPVEQYATLELNQVAFPKTGMVVSQTPLGTAFTKDAPCENGMWVVADKAAGVIDAPAAATDKPIGIVYTAEKEYDIMHYGLKTFGRKVAGDYPRVGILGIGDTFTTNCLQYDTADYADDTALDTALKAIDSAAMYVGIKAGSPVPQLLPAAKKPANGPIGKVVKYYTVPNGEKGVKYQIISL